MKVSELILSLQQTDRNAEVLVSSEGDGSERTLEYRISVVAERYIDDVVEVLLVCGRHTDDPR